ncbi:hypothetical protein HZA33_04650 [Candidatus Pacearchaeota archaeon]|nr:hypothetical protein [Candidatus Pacearchaeota archaeon]
MTNAYEDIEAAFKRNFYKDSSGEIYQIGRIITSKGSTSALAEVYRLRQEGGLERFCMHLADLRDLQNIGKLSDFANEKGEVIFKEVLEKVGKPTKPKVIDVLNPTPQFLG